tara:strand:- start:199 stop:777 length:579 start_codon:yes stop_codon:yes gene_type:complete
MTSVLYEPPYLEPETWIQIADKRLGRFLKRYALDIVKDQTAAEDVVQKTYLKVYARLTKLAEMSYDEKVDNWPHSDQWLIRAVRNNALSYLRDQQRSPELYEFIEEVPERKRDVLTNMVLAEEWEQLQAALDHIPPMYAEILYLYFGQISLTGKPNLKKIADMLGMKLNTVKIRIFRAKKAINKLLSDGYVY